MIDRSELLRRIQTTLGLRGWSERQACLAAALSQDYVRNLRRFPDNDTGIEKLAALADALQVDTTYFVNDRATPDGFSAESVIHLDRERMRDAQRAADRAMRGESFADPETVRANITAVVYDSLTERARMGKPLKGEAAEDFVDGLIRGIVADTIKNR